MTDQNLKSRSIGIFDSGFGGLTVMQEIVRVLPKESIIYLGDTAHVPYGDKSQKAICQYSYANSEFLIKQNIKLLVIACHTASVYALEEIQKRYQVPVIGVVSCGIRQVCLSSKNFKVGVIGTRATIRSNVYFDLLKKKNPSFEITSILAPLLVPLIEEGWVDEDVTREIVRKYLQPLKKKNIDALLLACTHYPLLQSLFEKELSGVNIVNSATCCADEVKELLKREGLLSTSDLPSFQYFFTDMPDNLPIFATKLMKLPAGKISKVEEKRDEFILETCLNST